MTAHYLFAHRLLPGLYDSDLEATIQHLRQPGWLSKLWNHALVHCHQSPSGAPPQCVELKSCLLVVMPPPEEFTEAYFLALPLKRGPVYTLELGEDYATGQSCGVLGAWQERTHMNFGNARECSLDFFTGWVHSQLSGPS